MEGSSRTAAAAAHERLETLAGSLDEAGVGRLAEDLAAVARLLDEQYAVRRSLADPAMSADARAQLLRRLVEGKVGEAALDLLSGVVRERWSQPVDLATAVGDLSASARLALAERQGVLDDVEDELFRFARIVERDPQLALALSNPSLPAARKTALLHRLLDERARPVTVALVEQALAESHGRSFDRRLDALTRLAAARRQRLVAVVRVARPLDEDQQGRLAEALSHLYGRAVQLQVDLDLSLLGGVVVEIGDEVLDGSVARRLSDVRRRLETP